jgi:hypothetical protein
MVKPVLTSPLMSGEASISGEVLISGEICMPGEVLISGEVHISGEVNVPVYRFSVTQASPAKAEIELIDFNLSGIDTTALQISDWFVAEEGASILSRCYFVGEGNEQLRCLPTPKVQVNSETRSYILYAKLKAITGVGSFKIYSAVIAYNGGKGDAINQTTPINIHYTPIISCSKPPICPQFMPPVEGWCKGGEIIPGGTDSNGCPLPPKCKPVSFAACSVNHYSCNV